jgi:hypothetical protein
VCGTDRTIWRADLRRSGEPPETPTCNLLFRR